MAQRYVVKDVLTESYYNGKDTPLGLELVSRPRLAKQFASPEDAKAWSVGRCVRDVEIEQLRSLQQNSGALAQQTINDLINERDALERKFEMQKQITKDLREEFNLVRAERDRLDRSLTRSNKCIDEMKRHSADCERAHPVRIAGSVVHLTDDEVQEYHDDGECIDDCPICEGKAEYTREDHLANQADLAHSSGEGRS